MIAMVIRGHDGAHEPCCPRSATTARRQCGAGSASEKRQGRKGSDFCSGWPPCGLWLGQGDSPEQGGVGRLWPCCSPERGRPAVPSAPWCEPPRALRPDSAWKADWPWSDSHSNGEVSPCIYGPLASLFPSRPPPKPHVPSISVSPRVSHVFFTSPQLSLTRTH